MLVDITRDSLKNHLAFTQAEFMKSFLPKFAAHGFNHFSYGRMLSGQRRMLLTSHPDYSEASIKYKFHTFAFFGPPEIYSDGIFLSDFLNLGEIRPVLEAHNINKHFVIIKKRADIAEHYDFGTSRTDPLVNHFFINNLDLFEQLIQEFDKRAQALLKKYEDTLLLYPKNIKDTTGLAQPNLRPLNQDLLSPREREIFEHIKRGLSSKETARKLNISPRTIEKHIENMFIKTNTDSRIELLRKLVYF